MVCFETLFLIVFNVVSYVVSVLTRKFHDQAGEIDNQTKRRLRISKGVT